MKVVLLFCALLLTGCALSETEVKTEAKVRFDKIYPVELAHYEYEERLQTFYDAEEILPEHLGRLYRGEFPNGETLPNRLRIHWTNARALAQAEVELQKDILGWAGAEVSPRPILVNDPNEKFYRYYEYRVLKGGKEVGAVRIPAYRRTENFATAEVHQYNGDASQYTVKPTGWGDKILSELDFTLSGEDYKAFSLHFTAIVEEFIDAGAIKISDLHQFMQEYLDSTGMIESMVPPISEIQANNDVREYVLSCLNGRHYDFSVIEQTVAYHTTVAKSNGYQKKLEQVQEQYIKNYIVDEFIYKNNAALLLGEELARTYLLITENTVRNTYSKMQNNTSMLDLGEIALKNQLKKYYWQTLEDNLLSQRGKQARMPTIVVSALIQTLVSITKDITVEALQHGASYKVYDWDKVKFNALSTFVTSFIIPGTMPGIQEALKTITREAIWDFLYEKMQDNKENMRYIGDWFYKLYDTIDTAKKSQNGYIVMKKFVENTAKYVMNLSGIKPNLPSWPAVPWFSSENNSGGGSWVDPYGGWADTGGWSANPSSHQPQETTRTETHCNREGVIGGNCTDPSGHQPQHTADQCQAAENAAKNDNKVPGDGE